MEWRIYDNLPSDIQEMVRERYLRRLKSDAIHSAMVTMNQLRRAHDLYRCYNYNMILPETRRYMLLLRIESILMR